MELRSAIADYLEAFRGICVRPEQVLVGAGTEYLYGLLIQLLGFDRVYACENPGYRKISQVFEAYGVRHRGILLDEYGLSVQDLERSGADVVHVTPAHHFPTGITMPAARRYELLQWAMKGEGRYIIEDDYDSEFRMTGKPSPALFESDRSERVIYMNTFTRSLASTIRVSYMILPEALLRRYRSRLSFYSCTVSTFEQYTLAKFIAEGYFEKHINRMRNASRKKRNRLLELIHESELRTAVTVLEKDAGLHFLLELRLNSDPDEIKQGLAREGIHVLSLDQYFVCPDMSRIPLLENADQKLVINYASIPWDRLEETVRKIERACIELVHCSVNHSAKSLV